jgi:holliday junction DNA helicase RuvA
MALIKNPPKRVFYDFNLFIAATNRDFFRAAVFSLITPLFAALSIALYASGTSDSAFAISPDSNVLRTFLIMSLIVLLRRILNIRFRALVRTAFFAFLVIAIFFIYGQHYTCIFKKNQLLPDMTLKVIYSSHMIRLIIGTVANVELRSVVVHTASGVGYLIHTVSRANFLLSQEITLHTYLAVRENSLDLYGFETSLELEWFELLLSIPKIGPKSALQIIEQATPDLLFESISKNDATHLSKLSGIGKKTSEKIVTELKEKLPSSSSITLNHIISNTYNDTFDTLLTLGYNPNEIRMVLDSLYNDNITTSELVKKALQEL